MILSRTTLRVSILGDVGKHDMLDCCCTVLLQVVSRETMSCCGSNQWRPLFAAFTLSTFGPKSLFCSSGDRLPRRLLQFAMHALFNANEPVYEYVCVLHMQLQATIQI